VVTFQKEVGTVRFPTKGQQPVPKFAFALPLLIQALPLSLKTFWRYLLVLPLLAIVPLVLLLVGFIPLIGIIAPGVAYAFCIMIGLRSALVARGHTPQADFGQMLRYGTVFSLLTMVATSLINALSALLPLPVYLALGWFNGLANGRSAHLDHGGRHIRALHPFDADLECRASRANDRRRGLWRRERGRIKPVSRSRHGGFSG